VSSLTAYLSNQFSLAGSHCISGVMLTSHCHYKEVGASIFDSPNRDKVKRSAVKKLEALGYEVTLKTNSEPSDA
jgi:hypothetical protein